MIQSTGPVLLSGPHAADLAFRSMSFTEELSAPFVYSLEVLSDKNDLSANDFLGQPMTVHLEVPGGKRVWNGWVSEFHFLGGILQNTLYRIVLRPWLWFLRHGSDCRVYPQKNVPDILKEVFSRNGISDIDPQLNGDHEKREYVVQYRESDFNFVSRLMEDAGIHYFFRHFDGRHELVLCDSLAVHTPTPGYQSVLYLPGGDRRRLQVEHVHHWQSRQRVVSGGVILTDLDFEAPQAFLNQDVIDPAPHLRGDHLVFDYPGGYVEPMEHGRAIARRRLEEIQAHHERAQGETNARGMAVGATFQLKDHPTAAHNREYLVVSMQGRVVTHALESTGAHDDEDVFRAQFTCQPTARPFRPPRRTPRPVIHGAQTAVVVGKKDNEIWTDEYGRVKLRFHWDRFAKGEGDECRWVRVAQVWAGSKFGAMHIPRVGQEVIVEFLEGDPEQPIVTGRVYNFDNMPPYTLPENGTQSGIKSRSSKGGNPDNFNEIRFEDKMGQEDLFIHAERTQTTKVKASQSITVGGSRTVTVGGEETHTITGKETQTFDDAREMKVKLTNTETVGELHTANYKKGRTVNVDTANDALNVKAGNRVVDITGEYTIKCTGQYKVTHGSDHVIHLEPGTAKLTNGTSTLKLAKDNADLSNGKAQLTLKAGEVTINGPDKITIKCGGSTIEISSAGVNVKGTVINLNS